jgi:hypothetical protein
MELDLYVLRGDGRFGINNLSIPYHAGMRRAMKLFDL